MDTYYANVENLHAVLALRCTEVDPSELRQTESGVYSDTLVFLGDRSVLHIAKYSCEGHGMVSEKRTL